MENVPEPANPVITPMQPRHIPVLAELEARCFSEPWSEQSLRTELTNPLAVFYVTEVGDRIAGYVGMYHVIDEANICNIAVHPDSRRRGIAAALLAKIDEYARQRHLRLVTLEVRTSNTAAIRLYETCGFQQQGVRRAFYRKPAEDAVIMTKYYEYYSAD